MSKQLKKGGFKHKVLRTLLSAIFIRFKIDKER